jgi:CRISPR-associated protein Cas1
LDDDPFFSFHGRSRRPPLDPVNAVLSYLYAISAHDCTSALESVGLDPSAGFLHRDRPGRRSLALDLMEEFRACLVDRFVLSLFNRKQLKKKDFAFQGGGSVLLQDDARKGILAGWQERKQEMIMHPWIKERIQIGLLPYVQARLLARFIQGDLDMYPSFIWK